MENATTQSQEGLLEPVFPGSVTFDENILAPLQNNYLYKESKKCFTYNSAHLINNAALQKRYAAFCTEKREKGYSEQELEESFGFLLFDDVNEAKKVGETGLLVGQAKCTTLGDSSKGVYISKYSDCLDLKRWYDGKTGYIVLVKLRKGRVKEVTDNYTQNFTPPTPGFDCHVSEQLGTVTSTTSSFLAYERTQYYMYEHISGGSETESCPRQACPFAIVAFSYGATAATSGLEEKSQDKKVFRYKPWIGQLKIESAIYDVGLQSVSGAWFPTKLPKMVKIDHAIGVSELKRTLPREIFETCLVGEVCIDGRCFNLYDVVSSKAKNDLAQITKELKEKNLALVIPLNDSGFLILLHSSHLFSYEDAKSGKAAALQGMFIFPDSRAVPRDTKCALPKNTVSTDVIQAIPALNYAETEMEKCPADPQDSPNATLEKHLQNYATLIQPGLLDNPTREASTFPDQYDVPSGFTLIAPKWSQESGTRLKSYFEEPCGFTVPVVRALKLLSAERQQRSDEDDDVYYYISSPEEVPRPSAEGVTEVTEQTETIGDGHSTSGQPTEQTQPVLKEGLETLRTEYPTSTVSPKLGDMPKENCVSTDGKKSQACNEGLSSKETPLQTSSTQTTISTKQGGTAVSEDLNNAHPEKTMVNKVDWRSLPRRRGRNRKMHWKTLQVKKEVLKELALPTSSLHLILPVNSSGSIKDTIKEKPESDCRTANHIIHSKGRRRKRRGVRRNLSGTRLEQASFESPVVSTSVPTETIHDQIKTMDSLSPTKRDWRSLPRRKRLWNTDANLKRCLRSDVLKTDNNDSLSSESSMDVLDKGLSRGPKRKMEGLTLKERYGLKTIITKCGRVFVPHGSDVASGDVDSSNKEESEGANENIKAEVISPVENQSTEMVKSGGESPSKVSVVSDGIDSSYSPSKDKSSVQLVLPITILGQHDKSKPSEMDMTETSTSNEVTCLQHTNKDHSITVQADETTSPEQPVSSLLQLSSPEKNKKKTKHVYSAISISKLKTVLRRGKRSKSPAPAGDVVCEPEPESKKGKSEVITDNISNCKQLKDKTLQSVSDTTQNSSMSHGGQEPMKTLHNESVPWSGLLHNGSLNFHTSAPFEIVKRVDEQLISSLIGEGVGRISIDGKGSTEKLTVGATLPSDALSLLADLALSASNSKAVADLEVKPGLETDAGVKGAGSPESVLHALLRCPSSRFNLPSRSPFPEGLLVTGELILEISKEHSYSQPTSLLSGLSGTCPPVCSPSGCVESPLSLKTGPHPNLPVDATTPFCQKEGGKMGWKDQFSPNGAVPSNSKTKTRRSRIFHDRRVFEEKGLLQVDRNWSEKYDFKYDSKFTNDSLDKTIMRALHGNWNYDMEDTQEEMYLIFHMWIGLFYSKTTSRLFHLENTNPLPNCKGQKDVKGKRDGDPIQNSVSLLNVELNLKDHSAKLSDILDLSVKNDEPVNLHLALKQSQGGDAVSPHGAASREMAPKHLSSGLSSSPKVTALMNHRSAVDIPVENVQSDNENDVEDDNENDITTDCSYTQLLEGNSAYSQLCEKASDMSISIGPRMSLSKVTNVSKNVTPTKPTSFKPKNVGVFHQVLCHIKPSAFSYCHGIVLGRKTIDESLKNKPGNGVFVQQKEEDVSKIAESNAVSVCDKTVEKNADESPVLIQKESVSEMKDSKDITDEDSEDDSLKIVEDETFEKNVTSKSSSSDAEFNPLPDQKDHTDEFDSLVDELKDNLSPEVKNETSNACKDLEPLLNPEDHSNAVDASSCVVEENDTEEPVEERDETCKVEEKLQESEEKTDLDGSNSECKTSTTVVTHSDEFVVDNVDNVDMEISDEDSDENATIHVYELNVPTVKSFVLETFIQEDHDVESKVKNETQTEKPEVCHMEANPEDDAQIETDVLCSVDACLLACQPMCVEEKTTIASNNDVMQSEKENVTLDQKIVIEEEALDMCERDPKLTENIESSQLEISHLDKDEESDVNENDRPSETLYSCEDKTQVMDTHQKCQSPKICASSPHTTTNSCDKTVIPQDLKKITEDEVNSTCSTPTQDEVSYDAEREEILKEVSDFTEVSNRDQHCTDDIDHDITMSPCSQVYTKMPFSDSIEETSSEEPGLKKTKYTSPMDLAVKDKSPSSSSEHPEIQFFKHKLSPTSQQKDVEVNITESTPQNNSEPSYRDYDVDEFHEYHNRYPSDKYCPWTNFKTDGADSHQYEDDDYYYPCDEDYSDVGYPVYNTSEVSQGSYEANIKELDFCQTKKSCKSSSLDDASRNGSFKGQTKISYTPQYATSTDSSDRISHKRSRKVYSQEDLLNCTVDYSVRNCIETYQTKPTRTVTVNCLSQGRRNKQRFDWRRYFRREATSRELYDTDSEASNRFDVPPSSIVTILDQKGNRVTFDNSLTAKPSVDTHRITTGPEDSSRHCHGQQSKVDMTQSAVDLEYLIFSEQLNRIVKESKSSLGSTSRCRSSTDIAEFPMSVQFSNLNELQSPTDICTEQTSLNDFKIKVELSDTIGASGRKPRRFCEVDSRMNDGKNISRQTEAIKRKWDQVGVGQQHVRKDAFDNLQDNLNFTVRRECNVKYRFYILVTSADTFFEETRNLLMMEGHVPVDPDEFDLGGNSQSPLLVILRNEDVAEHISEVPYLLELKKSSNVLFAGIDRPDDVVNFTHQELFADGGFIVCDEQALDKLTLDNMKKVAGILEELDKKGKWKWFLHYKDSRKLRESARSSQEASKKQRFIDCCQEAGIIEILPYHDCDVMSQGRPDYLYCLTHLQIQNASVRFPVFITDTSSDAFENNGILTMDIYTFCRMLSKDTCHVS